MREWIEMRYNKSIDYANAVLPRMREWIEIPELLEEAKKYWGSPSYEGVD